MELQHYTLDASLLLSLDNRQNRTINGRGLSPYKIGKRFGFSLHNEAVEKPLYELILVPAKRAVKKVIIPRANRC